MIDQIQKTTYVTSQGDSRQSRRLIILAGMDMQSYDLQMMGKDRLFFGRDASQCDIVINSPVISRVHGKIKMQKGKLLVADMGSTNGMYIFEGQHYNAMQPRTYYKKMASDLILRVESRRPENRNQTVVFVFTNSDNQGAWKRMPIGNQPVTIGRDVRNTIVMEQPSFSRRHAMIRRQGDAYVLHDNNSMNGVYINGKRIQNDMAFHESDIIQIAGSLFFVQNQCLLYQQTGNGISIHLDNITKEVKDQKGPRRILDRVCCDIASNEFVAIIGGSGAGKTTVMTAMSGFDSRISGRVSCNGIDLHENFSTLKNMIGFVPQQDIIYENLKLSKMLRYTAKMRMPSDTTPDEQMRRIQKVLEMVGLQDRADTYIRKLSGGQKKRASIAVELLADPGLFFLDEPTSGLDPDTEQSLMKTLAGLSKSEGKTIIMVTHTTQSIHLCDKVIFMGPGGKICYCGPPAEIAPYFGKDNLVDVYSELAVNAVMWNRRYMQNYMGQGDVGMSTGADMMKRINDATSRQVSPVQQLGVLVARYFELIWNDKQRLLLLFLQPLIIAFLLTIVAKSDVFKKFSDTQSILFALACSGIWIGLFNTIQEVCKERPILKREYMGNLRLWAYIVSKYIVQGGICLVQTTILTTVFLTSMEHAPEKALFLSHPQMEIWITVFLTIYASAAMGLIVSSLVKNSDRAMAVAPFVLIIQLLFSGVLFELEGAAHKISYITVSRWSMEALGNIADLNKMREEMFMDAKDIYERGVSHLTQTWGILLAMALLCGIISVVVLRSLKEDQR